MQDAGGAVAGHLPMFAQMFETVEPARGAPSRLRCPSPDTWRVASYSVNPDGVARCRELIDKRQYVLNSDWGDVQPDAEAQNGYLDRNGFEAYAGWFLGLTEGATDETKGRYAFGYGDFRRVHRSGLIACVYRAAEWRHKDVELAAHDLLQRLDTQGRDRREGLT